MKLTAPPPPPSPDENPNQPGAGQGAGQPNEPSQPNTNDPQTPPGTPPEAPLSPPAQPQPQGPPATWPVWFAGADVMMVTLVLGLAFLVSSFIARNSDIWLHLAAGKRLLSGEYSPGTDPFSYSASDRPWVNHSLLFDVGVYLLYRGDGVVLVVLKALAVALTFGLLIAIRRPGFALWPWAAVAAVGVLAAAPRLNLSPIVGSTLLLAVTMFLLFRLPHRPGSWRFPAAIGVTFWVWAQIDSWFILGPLTLVLVVIGELIQSYLGTATAREEPGVLGQLPDRQTLLKALGIGIIACMLNPHHIRVWELPFELAGSKVAEADLRIRQTAFLTPLDKIYLDNKSLGKNINGLAYGVLLAGGGVVIGIGVGRIRATYIVIWLAYAVMSLLMSMMAVPFFAVVAVPLIASQFNALSSSITLGDRANSLTRLILLGSTAGRVLCLIAITSACALAWPGWMQPEPANPAFSRRVAWGIEADAGLVRAAEQLQTWRTSGRLSAETRGIMTSFELANHCAWFAPQEKVFLNGDFQHHRKELADFVGLRKALGLVHSDEPIPMSEIGAVLDRVGAEYLVIAATQGDGQRQLGITISIQLWLDEEHWSPWYLDGRSAMSGWESSAKPKKYTFTETAFSQLKEAHVPDPILTRLQPLKGKEGTREALNNLLTASLGEDAKRYRQFIWTKVSLFEGLQLDPVLLAFGPDTEKLPSNSARPIPPPEGWEGEFVHGIELSPPSADEAIAWGGFRVWLQERHARKERMILEFDRFLAVPPSTCLDRLVSVMKPRRQPPLEEAKAAAILSLRAARKAIAAAPDIPDGYYAWLKVLENPDLDMKPSERAIATITAMRQCLMRIAPPDSYKRGAFGPSPSELALELASRYLAGIPVDLPFARVAAESQFSDGLMGRTYRRSGEQVVPVFFPWRRRNEVRDQAVAGPLIMPLDLARDLVLLAGSYAEAEMSLETDTMRLEALEKRLKSSKDLLKNLDERIAKQTEELTGEKIRAGGQMNFRNRVKAELRYNKVGEALKLLKDPGTELPKEFGEGLHEILFVQVALELLTGKLEDASDDLKYLPQFIDSARGRPDFAQIKQLLGFLEIQTRVFEGNYAAAGETLENLYGNLLDKIPPPTPEQAALTTKPLFVLGSPEALLQLMSLAPIPAIDQVARFEMIRQKILIHTVPRQDGLLRLRGLVSEEFYTQRGLFSLYEGDIAAARRRFVQARQPAIPDWGVPAQSTQLAEQYLHLIDEAAARAQLRK